MVFELSYDRSKTEALELEETGSSGSKLNNIRGFKKHELFDGFKAFENWNCLVRRAVWTWFIKVVLFVSIFHPQQTKQT